MTTNINELIKKHCPNGVNKVDAGEVFSLEYGKSLKESERRGGAYPVMGSNGRVGFHDTYLVEGPCIVVGRKGSAGALTWENENCYPIDTAFFIKPLIDINLRFLFYLLQTQSLTEDKQDGGVPGINRNKIYRLKIQVPPLPVQREIVRILDKFTELEAELEAELAARQKQYKYYRESLFLSLGVKIGGGGRIGGLPLARLLRSRRARNLI